ncbi:(Na+)-NQR maturation NqrM [Candidatus Fukatsuia symbiotica]|uniref:(Na+)-NQR maturation NqrM n=1 Tax=Candidatus Fukatsuia symbiotica TaxID=1878942 RepID=A0A2U8I886_9GAMM|nr:(Na+)-NQR maturation NqrM [Candidatus Fukatsuia symbiotica]AWK14295.1 hypothetical protein CCS41_07140 [Candidatus Fukatsuia symbiotica]MEA9444547.1 (Na+)-NQR maturation NqrM [Candidatus Fukatsuia symbiotica]
MLTLFIVSFIFFLLITAGMSLGYLVNRKSLQGSCGGMTQLGMEKVCDCPEPCDIRKKKWVQAAAREKKLAQYRIL